MCLCMCVLCFYVCIYLCVCVCVCVCGELYVCVVNLHVCIRTHTRTLPNNSGPLPYHSEPLRPPLSLFLSPPFSLSCTHTRILTLSRCLWPFSVLSFPLSPPLLQDGGVVLLLQVEEDTDVTGPVASETGAVCIM